MLGGSAERTIPMILQPFRRDLDCRSIVALYGTIVTQARSVVFYVDYGVPDTMQGRFDMIVLHLVLVLRRLGQDNGHGRSFGQRLFDTFCRDLDGNLREMGVGDLAMPKHMRRLGEAFYGRQAAYLSALDSQEGAGFENVLARNIFQNKGGDERVARLACYARAVARELDAQRHAALIRGEVIFPNPEAIVYART